MVVNNTDKPTDPKKTKKPATELDSLRYRIEALEETAIKRARRKQRFFNKHYPLLYAFFAFIGVMLLWYGAWTIISVIPIISNPYVASGLGLVILLILGQFYNNLI
jgi:hypothetical protein